MENKVEFKILIFFSSNDASRRHESAEQSLKNYEMERRERTILALSEIYQVERQNGKMK